MRLTDPSVSTALSSAEPTQTSPGFEYHRCAGELGVALKASLAKMKGDVERKPASQFTLTRSASVAPPAHGLRQKDGELVIAELLGPLRYGSLLAFMNKPCQRF